MRLHRALRFLVCRAAWVFRLWLLTCPAWTDAQTAGSGSSAPTPISLKDVLQSTLAQQPAIRIAAQDVVERRALLLQARSLFDLNLQAGLGQRGDTQPVSPLYQLNYGGPASVNTGTTSYFLTASNRFRWGMSASATIQIQRIAQNTALSAYGQSTLSFSIVQPLLRGRGSDATAAGERSAELDQEASQHHLRFTINQQIRDACLAYFVYVTAVQSVSRWAEAEERAQQLLADERRLISAGQRPASNLKLLLANVAEVQAAAAEAQRHLQESKQALLLVMGLHWSQLDQIGPPRDELLALSVDALPDASQLPRLIGWSLQQRADLAALDQELLAAQVLTLAARRNREPRLDAQVDLGYSGLAEGGGAAPFVTAPYQNVAGVNFYAGLAGQFPVQNRAARGALLQRQAIEARLRLGRDNLKRQIGASVALSVSTLRSAQQALASADGAVGAYQGAVEDERKKLRAGLSTVFDLVQVQGRLNSATQSALSARARLASLLVQARFETGTLLSEKGGEHTLHADELLRFPNIPPP